MVYNINYSGSKEAPFALSLAFRTVNTQCSQAQCIASGLQTMPKSGNLCSLCPLLCSCNFFVLAKYTSYMLPQSLTKLFILTLGCPRGGPVYDEVVLPTTTNTRNSAISTEPNAAYATTRKTHCSTITTSHNVAYEVCSFNA